MWAVLLLVGYLVGSIPMAYFAVHLAHRKDVSKEGSGNVGALNAFRVSKSKALGAAVILLDAAKGAAAVFATSALGGDGDLSWLWWAKGLGLLGALAGHNYNLWLSLRAKKLTGGKGFAALAGSSLVCMPWLVLIWLGILVVGLVGFWLWRGVKDEAPSSALATLCIPIAANPLYGWTPSVIWAIAIVIIVPKVLPDLRQVYRDSFAKAGPPTTE